MAAQEVKLEDFSKTIKGFAAASIEKKRKAVVGGLARSISMLVESSPVDTGLYAQSWQFTETETSAILGNTAPHAGAIEFGTRPHVPPMAPLFAWAKRVLQDPSQPPDYSSTVKDLAFAVRNKIAKYGQEPKHILENALPQIIDNIRMEFEGLKK